jgi:hypothetical protein
VAAVERLKKGNYAGEHKTDCGKDARLTKGQKFSWPAPGADYAVRTWNVLPVPSDAEKVN